MHGHWVNENNDLEDYYRRLMRVDEAVKQSREAVFNKTIVGDGNCPSAIIDMMKEKGCGSSYCQDSSESTPSR